MRNPGQGYSKSARQLWCCTTYGSSAGLVASEVGQCDMQSPDVVDRSALAACMAGVSAIALISLKLLYILGFLCPGQGFRACFARMVKSTYPIPLQPSQISWKRCGSIAEALRARRGRIAEAVQLVRVPRQTALTPGQGHSRCEKFLPRQNLHSGTVSAVYLAIPGPSAGPSFKYM